MQFNLRRLDDYAVCSVSADNTVIDMGLLSNQEATKLLEEFKSAVDELEWFINATKKDGE